jgi:hypothetical protein
MSYTQRLMRFLLHLPFLKARFLKYSNKSPGQVVSVTMHFISFDCRTCQGIDKHCQECVQRVILFEAVAIELKDNEMTYTASSEIKVKQSETSEPVLM